MARSLYHLLWLVPRICNAQVVITSTIIATSTICPCTSQTSIQPSPSTSSTPTAVSSSTSFFSATTSAAPGPMTTPFPIRIDTRSFQRKRATYYIAFEDDTAIGVDTLDAAALFTIVDGYLLNNGMFVGSNASAGYQTMRRYVSPDATVPGWSLGEDRTVSLNGQEFTQGDGSADFCISTQGAIIIEVTQTAPACNNADLAALLIPSSSSSTMPAMSQISSSMTSTPDTASTTTELILSPMTSATSSPLSSTGSIVSSISSSAPSFHDPTSILAVLTITTTNITIVASTTKAGRVIHSQRTLTPSWYAVPLYCGRVLGVSVFKAFVILRARFAIMLSVLFW